MFFFTPLFHNGEFFSQCLLLDHVFPAYRSDATLISVLPIPPALDLFGLPFSQGREEYSSLFFSWSVEDSSLSS